MRGKLNTIVLLTIISICFASCKKTYYATFHRYSGGEYVETIEAENDSAAFSRALTTLIVMKYGPYAHDDTKWFSVKDEQGKSLPIPDFSDDDWVSIAVLYMDIDEELENLKQNFRYYYKY